MTIFEKKTNNIKEHKEVFMSYLKNLYIYLKSVNLHKEAGMLRKIAGETDYSFELPNFDFLYDMKLISNISLCQKNPSVWMNRFIDINSDIFIKDMPVSKIGSGMYGEAWITESGNVMKIFKGIGALKFYEQEKESFENDEGEESLHVYEFGAFRMPEGTILENIIGWAIMEKLKNVKDIDREANFKIYDNYNFEQLISWAIYLIEGAIWEEERKLQNSDLKKMDYAKLGLIVIKNIASSREGAKLIPLLERAGFGQERLLQMIINTIRQYVKGRGDTHAGNLGFRDNGMMIYFDPYTPGEEDNNDYRESYKDEIYWDEQAESDKLQGAE